MLREKLMTRRFWQDLFKPGPVDAAAGEASLFALGRRLRPGQHVFHEMKSVLAAGAHRNRRDNPNELSWADESGRHLRARR